MNNLITLEEKIDYIISKFTPSSLDLIAVWVNRDVSMNGGLSDIKRIKEAKIIDGLMGVDTITSISLENINHKIKFIEQLKELLKLNELKVKISNRTGEIMLVLNSSPEKDIKVRVKTAQ
tara:strand:+ start:2753 stop:3112 length:360 start_codon:yes stop_codon:yes gene_type:complete